MLFNPYLSAFTQTQQDSISEVESTVTRALGDGIGSKPITFSEYSKIINSSYEWFTPLTNPDNCGENDNVLHTANAMMKNHNTSILTSDDVGSQPLAELKEDMQEVSGVNCGVEDFDSITSGSKSRNASGSTVANPDSFEISITDTCLKVAATTALVAFAGLLFTNLVKKHNQK